MNVKIYWDDPSGLTRALISEACRNESLPPEMELYIIHDKYEELLFYKMEIPSHGLSSSLLLSRNKNNLIIFVCDSSESVFKEKHFQDFSELIRETNVVFLESPITISKITAKFQELLAKNNLA